MYWYNATKSKNRFKKHKDKSGVELSDLKISKTTFSSDGLPAVRPTSVRHMGPILSITKALAACNTDLLFEEVAMVLPFIL